MCDNRRRVISTRANGKRKYEYLTKWENWEIFDCTWQPPSSFDRGGIKPLEDEFLLRCRKEGINDRSRVVLIPEVEVFWDENGDLKEGLLEELGVPGAEWNPEPRGDYRIKYA